MERITSRKNPLAVRIKKLGANRSYREENGEFLCDGIKLLEDAALSVAEILTVLTASHVPFPLPVETRVYYADRSLIDSLSPLKNAQDTLFTCRLPQAVKTFEKNGTHILLDRMQDPGNVGAIIRTANAFGIKSVILTDGSADPYNPKTLRASMGAIFRQSLSQASMSELVAMKDYGARFIGAVHAGCCRDVSTVNLKDSIIAIGSEGRGLSNDILALCEQLFTIPISNECESLNAAAAAAIIIWEARNTS